MAGGERLGGWEEEGEKERRGKGGERERALLCMFSIFLYSNSSTAHPPIHLSIHSSFGGWLLNLHSILALHQSLNTT